MKAVISICYHVEINLARDGYPASCNTPVLRLQYEIEQAERDPARYAGNHSPVVNGAIVGSSDCGFSEPY
ncbi:MAG: hypothetical protein ACK4UO_10025 [Pseudolabrys sp.]